MLALEQPGGCEYKTSAPFVFARSSGESNEQVLDGVKDCSYLPLTIQPFPMQDLDFLG